MKITLPARLDIESGDLFKLLACGEGCAEVQIDLSGLQRVSPAYLVAMLATFLKWKRTGKCICFTGMKECRITSYLQRMDFFSQLDISIPEGFTRHSSQGRFMPITTISHETDKLGAEMAACVAPGGEEWDHPMAGLYDTVAYVLSETANNVQQHSGGQGYASAQVEPYAGIVKFAIADNGKGIRQSFVDAGLPWSNGLSACDSILKALELRVSSRFSESNEGVGLTLVSKLTELIEGWLLIVSGDGMVIRSPHGFTARTLADNGHFSGTLIAMAFHRNRTNDWGKLLDSAKKSAGLLPISPKQRILFQ